MSEQTNILSSNQSTAKHVDLAPLRSCDDYGNHTTSVSVSFQKNPSSQSQSLISTLSSVSLAERFVGDIAVGAAVTATVTPFLTIIDQAIVQRASGSHSVLQSARASAISILSQPATYLKSPAFLWMWATYGLTYSSANMLRTITEHQEYQSLSQSNHEVSIEHQKRATATTLFVGTTLVNSSASMVKDRAYARLFGSVTSTTPTMVPKISYALWIARDLTVIGSSFVLPSYVSAILSERTGLLETTADKLAQVATPMAAQLVAGPLHFVGLDCFNRPSILPLNCSNSISDGTGFWKNRSRFWIANLSNRLSRLKSAWVEVVTARMVRVLPGYGIAGVYNRQLRNQYRNFLMERRIRHLLQLERDQYQQKKRRAPAPAEPSPTIVQSRNSTAVAVEGTQRFTSPPVSLSPHKTRDLVSLIRAKNHPHDAPNQR